MKTRSIGLFGFAIVGLLITASEVEAKPSLRSEVERLLHRSGAELNLFELENRGLREAQTPTQPWTSSYWPDAIGGIAVRYQTQYKKGSILGPGVGTAVNFRSNSKAYKGNNAKMRRKVHTYSEDQIAKKLSASEKYDFALGDSRFTFTNALLDEIEYRFDYKQDWKTGTWHKQEGLSSWVGICDGWTSAALHLPRPVRPVKVMSGSGQVITFYPDDIKALGAHLFARTNQWLGIERVGNRCLARKRKVEDASGNVLEDDCQDIDAGLWHATVLNRIGVDGRGFIIDVDNHSKVNNHPVFGYSVKYFNPVNGNMGGLKESLVPVGALKDGVTGIRKSNTVSVVGVEMGVTMLDYEWPSGEEYDSPINDKLKKEVYVYDLELDQNGQILGGQWHTQGKKFLFFGKISAVQPDMMWMLAPNQLAWSKNSAQVDEGPTLNPNLFELWGNVDWRYRGDGRIPRDWYEGHLKAAEFKWPAQIPYSAVTSPHPLAEMVYWLFDQARERSTPLQ